MTKLTITSATKDSPGAGQITIVGTYATSVSESTLPAQMTTVGNFPITKPDFLRQARVTDSIFSIRRSAVTPVGLDIATWISKVVTAFEAGMSHTPIITTDPSDDDCVASSTAATFTVAADSELTKTYQWQYESKASGTLTSDNTAPSDGDTVTIGNKTYTFKTTLTPTEGEVLINATADAALLNLIRAINHTGTPDTDYKCAAAHTQVQADPSVSGHAITVRALLSGTDGNSIATTETEVSGSHTAWGATLLSGGGTWASANGTILDCAYTNDTTVTLTATPTSTRMSGTEHRCVVTNPAGSATSESATLTIT